MDLHACPRCGSANTRFLAEVHEARTLATGPDDRAEPWYGDVDSAPPPRKKMGGFIAGLIVGSVLVMTALLAFALPDRFEASLRRPRDLGLYLVIGLVLGIACLIVVIKRSRWNRVERVELISRWERTRLCNDCEEQFEVMPEDG